MTTTTAAVHRRLSSVFLVTHLHLTFLAFVLHCVSFTSPSHHCCIMHFIVPWHPYNITAASISPFHKNFITDASPLQMTASPLHRSFVIFPPFAQSSQTVLFFRVPPAVLTVPYRSAFQLHRSFDSRLLHLTSKSLHLFTSCVYTNI